MHEIVFDKKALIFLEKLDKNTQNIIGKKIENLKTNSKLGKPLTGKLGGLWSLRVGDYRAIYQIRHDKLVILVLKLGYRKNVYD